MAQQHTASDKPGLLNRAAAPFVALVERYYPDPFVFVIVLTVLTLGLSLALTDASGAGVILAWGNGLSSLLAFTMQLALTLVLSHAFAHTDRIKAVLIRISKIPRAEWQAYAVICAAAGIASLITWPLGLVVGATLAKRIAVEGAHRGLRLDYPLLVASAYAGFVVWHMGYSGSAPLFVATPGHVLEAQIGILPVTETVFSFWNMGLAAITLAAVSATCALMRPGPGAVRPLGEAGLTVLEEEEREDTGDAQPETVGERIGASPVLSLLLGALVVGYLAVWFAQNGFSLNLNIVNWTLLGTGLLLARSPVHHVELCVDGGRSLGALLLQYPFYAGIMGVMAGTGLVSLFSEWIAAQASAFTLPLWAFFAGGLVNMFVPSGGGQWAVQGPVFIEAGQALGVPPALIVMAVAYGDQWTNMIQPFWTIPLLAIAGLRVGDVLGYTFIVLIVSGVIFTAGLMAAAMLLGAG